MENEKLKEKDIESNVHVTYYFVFLKELLKSCKKMIEWVFKDRRFSPIFLFFSRQPNNGRYKVK